MYISKKRNTINIPQSMIYRVPRNDDLNYVLSKFMSLFEVKNSLDSVLSLENMRKIKNMDTKEHL